MSFDPLDNYLRMYRKRAELSQDEVAHLLGLESGTMISRYEFGTREPTLEAALALEALFGVPVRELFAGRFKKTRKKVKKRARKLVRKWHRLELGTRFHQKLDTLIALIQSP